MEWLAKQPVLGPIVRWLVTTHAYRAFDRFLERLGNRLAGSLTYYGFLSLFPLLAVVGALGARILGRDQLKTLQNQIAQQIPGIADQLNLQQLADHAGTVSLIGFGVLLFSGLAGISTARSGLRTMWAVPESEGNPVKQKIRDFFAMIGLGIAGVVTLGGSALATSGAGRITEAVGLDSSTAGSVLLAVAGHAIALCAGFGLFCYVLTLLPMLRPPRRAVITGAALGAVVFEILKTALSGYLTGVAGKSMYGAFGVPVALLVWMNFCARLLLYCAAWTATADGAEEAAAAASSSPSSGEEEPEEEREQKPEAQPDA